MFSFYLYPFVLGLPLRSLIARTSALIRDKLADAIQKPEFFNRFWNSFRSSKVRQQANEALELLLHEYGLKANKIALAMEDEPSN